MFFVDELLVKERVCATSLWKMTPRETLEDLDVLEPRVSKLGDLEDVLESDEEEGSEGGEVKAESKSGSDEDEDMKEEKANGDGDAMDVDIRSHSRSRSRSP